ncbi:MAG: hypothetical protein AB9915_01300 [Candidatus Dojkabacteria bacterium]
MLRRNAPRKSEQKAIITISFFVLLSIPLVIFGLLQDNFDTRNRAYDELELSDENPCIISLPHVNPYTLEVGKTITIQVDAKLTNSGISGLEIVDSTGVLIHQESFEGFPVEIGTSFKYTPSKSGAIDILGLIKKAEGGSLACKISSPYDIKGLRAVASNQSPEFNSKPSDSKPSQDIKNGTAYEYTLSALDTDGDRINYFYSFTPRADWLKATVIEDGSSGKLTIKFKGSTDKPASYLANVLIHDGYSKHVRSQSWIISVSPSENDIPIIKIINPLESLRLNSGDSFKTSWEATDLNHIVRYQLYMTKNPTDEKSWITVDNNVPYNVTSYSVPTSSLNSGTYKLIARAVDNRDPAGIGTAISPEIVISRSSDPDSDTDDSIVMEEPQVTNMSPSSTDEITNPRPTIKATLVASRDGKIDEPSIFFKIDGIDISEKMKINRISESEYTLIYQPKEDLGDGIHKAEIFFKDSKGKEISKSWDFTITLSQGSEDSDSFNFFGYEIAKRTVLIIGIGVLVIVVALVAPFIIASIWKEDKSRREEDVYENNTLPPSIPSEENTYIQTTDTSVIKEKIESVPVEVVEEKVEDAWDSFSAPTPTTVEPVVPEPVIEEIPQEIVEPIIPTPEVIPAVEPEIPEPVVEPAIPTPEVVPTTVEPEVLPQQIVEPGTPSIPEPEIPNAEELQSISEQIKQQTENDGSEDTNSTQQ